MFISYLPISSHRSHVWLYGNVRVESPGTRRVCIRYQSTPAKRHAPCRQERPASPAINPQTSYAHLRLYRGPNGTEDYTLVRNPHVPISTL